MKQTMRIKWNGMDACCCGVGAPGEDYQLLYDVTYDGCTVKEWYRMIDDIQKIAKEFQTDNGDGKTPCQLLYDDDRLSADDYIIGRMSELWPDVKIDYKATGGFTIEIE